MRTIIKGGHVLDPGCFDAVAHIIIEDEKISDVIKCDSGLNSDIKHIAGPGTLDLVIDAQGCYVVPGLIDMHVHLRDPGQEYKESIETGINAAARGGFTSICCMPNTNPVNDNSQVTEYIIDTASKYNSVRVHPVAAISMGLMGNELAEYGELKSAGAVAVSDDGLPVADSQLMRRALEYAKGVGLKVIAHCEDPSLSGGDMNESVVSTRLGLSGIPNAAESIMVSRDIALSALTDCPVHIAHVSTRESVHAIRDAKHRGIPVTAETAPHYFTLTDEAVIGYNTHAKMNPPLRTELDKEAIIEGLVDGTIDVIATDHAPHSPLEKDLEFDQAANGIIGLETSLPLGLKLVDSGYFTFEKLIKKMSKNPSQILGLPCEIKPGAIADLTIIDPLKLFTYDTDKGSSKSKNSPFHNWEFKGMTTHTIINGRTVFEI